MKSRSVLFINLHSLLMMIIFAFITPTTISITPPNYTVAKPGCVDRCGNISIPFPFGTTENCYQDYSFAVTCNQTFDPPKLFFENSTVEIKDISPDGQVTILQYIGRRCYDQNGIETTYSGPRLSLQEYFTVNNTANKFTVVGCDTFAYANGRRLDRDYETGCTATCSSMEDLVEGPCMGLGCCQTAIPRDVWELELDVYSFNNHTNVSDFNNCSYVFLAEESAFNFSRQSFTSLGNIEELPMLADWAIGNGTCEEARMNVTSYACVSTNSRCYKPDNGAGYRCSCEDGYEGNPYLVKGCQDINECAAPGLHNCEHHCVNTNGSFHCLCPKGYHGNGTIGGEGCMRGQSLTLKIGAGVALAVIVLLLALCCLYLELKRRRLNSKKQKFFLQNGGQLLIEKLNRKERSQDMMKIFNSSELEKATNDFHSSMIIGQGGFGTVYKGVLPNNETVAIKKSKRVDPNQIDQFINEVIVLSQINHRNVVRLLGCCLDTEVPHLVYEFIHNGTLSANIHNQEKARLFNWGMRLKVATETAGVLSYLHSAASVPIIHRDVKSDNILLDHTYTAKVADFGASRLVPLDKTELSTMVQGTFGYLDPEYMQTNQLTEKSDVYSFGVVLLELLTGRRAISFDKPDNEKNLANFFLTILKQDRLFQVLDVNIVGAENMEQIREVASLAEWCLHVKGVDRPSMKQVAMELEGLRLGGKHSWAREDQNPEEMEFLLGGGLNGSSYNDGNSSTTVGYDSIRDHVILPVSGGR